jgi:hypothetical protein
LEKWPCDSATFCKAFDLGWTDLTTGLDRLAWEHQLAAFGSRSRHKWLERRP